MIKVKHIFNLLAVDPSSIVESRELYSKNEDFKNIIDDSLSLVSSTSNSNTLNAIILLLKELPQTELEIVIKMASELMQ